ncbi:MAG: fibronectin type III domain-containing protein [Solirubrobacterales bacterium]
MAGHPEQHFRHRPALLALVALLAMGALALFNAIPALAAKPLVESVSFSHVGETGATLEATVNPNGTKTTVYHFQYVTLAKYEASEFAEAEETPDGPALGASAGPTPFSAEITGLEPATAYRFRVFAENSKHEPEKSPPVAFSTYAVPLEGLPDGRVYEQASPLDKDGGDLTGNPDSVRAAPDGSGISFGSTSGIPGGVGTQQLPYYLATRSGEGAGASWLTQGLLPPADTGQSGKLLGWTPDFSRIYQQTARFGGGESAAILETRPGGAAPTQVTPFVKGSAFAFAGASADGSVAVFESKSAQLGTAPAGVEGRSNVYAWDAETNTLSLASRMNTEGETGGKLSGGAFAGPYDWAKQNSGLGGASRQYYTQDSHAVADDGSVFFTAAGTGHIYERLNPTAPQSALNGGGECAEPAMACTIDISASHRSTPDAAGSQPAAFHYASPNGDAALFTSSEKLTGDANTGPEVAGAPEIGRVTLNGEEKAEGENDEYLPGAHGLGVAVDGNHIYWVDPRKGAIVRATLNPSGPPTDAETFVDVAAEETCAETRPFLEPGVEQCGPSIPRYVAVQGEYVYWTNSGPLAGEVNHHPAEEPTFEAGTIGRAKINPLTEKAVEISPEFIVGASDPQGIAVNSEHIYWANSFSDEAGGVDESDIARAGIDGDDVKQNFFHWIGTSKPFGVALSATHVYWVTEDSSGFNVIHGIGLEGTGVAEHEVGENLEGRGLAKAGNYLYWAGRASGAIGRASLADLELPENPCAELASCEPEFITPGGALLGLAADGSGSHLYWSANGEVAPHPGNDLYRFQRDGTGSCSEPGGCLDDLTADTEDENGAEVLGVVAASRDASRVYFVANGVLSEAPNEAGEVASPGTCDGKIGIFKTGRCNLYLWEGGTGRFIARLNREGEDGGDQTDWLPTIASGVLQKDRSAFASADGKTLLFKSQERLTPYDNAGASELYLYRLGQGITCVSCDPTGAAPGGKATLGTVDYPALESSGEPALAARNLSADGKRAFFESVDPLVASDTDGTEGCPLVGSKQQEYPACRDVYEWEAPGTGSCEAGGPSYSPPNDGCLYLISTGKSDWTSIFADASESGDDVFFLTRSQLVGQDTDQQIDVYDARVGGGIAAQNQVPPEPCEGEACKTGASTPPPLASPATPGFQGTGNVDEKAPRPCPKGTVRRHGKCVKKHHRHHRKHHRPHRVDRGGRR